MIRNGAPSLYVPARSYSTRKALGSNDGGRHALSSPRGSSPNIGHSIAHDEHFRIR